MLDRGYARQILDHIHGVTTLALGSNLSVRLMTANGSDVAGGTELATGGGYTAGTGQPLTFLAATNTSPPSSANSSAVAFTNMPAGTIVGIEIWSGTMRLEYGQLVQPRTVAAGDTLSFAAGAIATTLA